MKLTQRQGMATIAGLIVLFTSPAQGAKSSPALDLSPDSVLVQTPNALVTVGSYNSELSDLQARLGRPATDPEKRDLFRRLTDRAILISEARDLDLDERPDMRDRIRRTTEQILLRQLLLEKFGGALSVTDTEGLQYYRENRQLFKVPETRDVLFVTVKTRKEVMKALEAAKETKNFVAVLERFGAKSRPPGDYYLQGVARHQLVPEFAQAVFTTAGGHVTDPIQTKIGWHVAYVAKITPARDLAYDEVRDDIQMSLFLRKGDELMAGYLTELTLQKRISIYGDRFQRLLKQKPSKLMK